MTDEIILDRIGNNLSVGDLVLFLQTPIIGEHEFISGKILQFGKKKVKIEATVRRSRFSEPRKTEVLRYPEQLIKFT